MPRTRIQFSPLSLCLVGCLVLGTSPVHAQQKYALRQPYVVGETVQVDGKMSMSLKMLVMVAGQKMDSDMTMREDESYRDEVLSVDAKGLPSGLRRVYTRKVEWSKETDKAETEKVSSLQGKTVEIRRRNGKVTLDLNNTKIDDSDRDTLLNALDSDETFLPEGDVAVGQEWTVDPKKALHMFSGGDFKVESLTLRCRLAEIVDYAGQRCGHIKALMDISGKPADSPLPFKINLTGDIYIALQTGRTLATDASGMVSMKGEITEGGVTVVISGEGPMKMSDVRKWSRK